MQKSDKENVTSVLGVQVDQEKGEAELEDQPICPWLKADLIQQILQGNKFQKYAPCSRRLFDSSQTHMTNRNEGSDNVFCKWEV